MGQRNLSLDTILRNAGFGWFGGRAQKDYLYSNGSTTNRGVAFAPGAPGAFAGLPVTFPFEGYVPTANPTASDYFVGVGPNAGSGDAAGQDNGFGIYIATNGNLRIRENSTTPSSNNRAMDYSGFRAAYAGQYIRGLAIFASPDTTTVPTILINKLDVTGLFGVSVTGAGPNWMHAALDTSRIFCGVNRSAGRFFPHSPIIGDFSAAEANEWFDTGRLPLWVETKTGSAVSLIATGNSVTNGAADANTNVLGSSSNATPSVQAGTRTGGAGSYVGRVTATAAAFSTRYTLSVLAGSRAKVTGWFRSSAASTLTGVLVGLYNNGTQLALLNTAPNTAWTPFTLEVTGGISDTNTLLFGGQGATSGDYVEFDDVVVQVFGPVFKPVIQPINVVADLSANLVAGVILPGIYPVTEKRDWVIQALTKTSGNEQLLGASLFSDFTLVAFDTLETRSPTTPTVAIGFASGGAQYKASGALVVGRNRNTPVIFYPGSAFIWVSSNTVDPLQHTIRGHMLD